MPAIVKRLSRGELVDVPWQAHSLDDAAQHEPRDGVYTVANTFKRTQTLLLGAHLDRLEDSARRAGFALTLDRDRIKAALRALILASGFGDVRFRISVPSAAPGDVILSIEPFAPPAADIISQGVRCQTTATARRHEPAAKSSEWMHLRRTLVAARPRDIYETFLLDEAGYLLEGLTSNVYALLDGELLTAASGILAGISRSIVLEICRGVVPLRPRAPHANDISRFSEAFLSSSSRGIIPVVEIDGIKVADGQVGATTLQLRERYQQWVGARLEAL